jgi:hypothetical protein
VVLDDLDRRRVQARLQVVERSLMRSIRVLSNTLTHASRT